MRASRIARTLTHDGAGDAPHVTSEAPSRHGDVRPQYRGSDDVVCSLQWDWKIPIPEQGTSVFEVPAAHVKGSRVSKLVVCNSVAQAVIDCQRGRHPDYVFVIECRHHPLGPVETMNNTAWQSARSRARLPDPHVHDLRHTVGMPLREAGVTDATEWDVLWHSVASITKHYTMAQIRELHTAVEKISKPTNNWNKSLQALKAEAASRKARLAPWGDAEGSQSP